MDRDVRQDTQQRVDDTRSPAPHDTEPGVRRVDPVVLAPVVDPYETPELTLDEPGYGHGV